MHDPELPGSPRKKLKLEASPLNGMLADPVAEAPGKPAIIPQHDIATANHQLTKPTLMHPGDVSDVLQTYPTATPASTPPIAVPEYPVKDLHRHPESWREFLNGKVMHASESTAGTVGDSLNKEVAYGITEFVSSDLLGFSGVLKKRYTFVIAAT